MWMSNWVDFSLLRNRFIEVQSLTPVYVFPAKGSTFLDSCDFERENICGMIQGPGDKADWIRVSTAAGGPSTDYSNMGKCTGENDLTGMHMTDTNVCTDGLVETFTTFI